MLCQFLNVNLYIPSDDPVTNAHVFSPYLFFKFFLLRKNTRYNPLNIFRSLRTIIIKPINVKNAEVFGKSNEF